MILFHQTASIILGMKSEVLTVAFKVLSNPAPDYLFSSSAIPSLHSGELLSFEYLLSAYQALSLRPFALAVPSACASNPRGSPHIIYSGLPKYPTKNGGHCYLVPPLLWLPPSTCHEQKGLGYNYIRALCFLPASSASMQAFWAQGVCFVHCSVPHIEMSVGHSTTAH